MRVQAAVQEPEECGIIGFGSAGGEGEFVGMGAEERGGFLACIVPCSASESAEAVATFRVPAGQKVWLHGFKNAWIEGSGGVGVEVDQGILFIRKSRFRTVVTHDFTGNCGTNPLSGWGWWLDCVFFRMGEWFGRDLKTGAAWLQIVW